MKHFVKCKNQWVKQLMYCWTHEYEVWSGGDWEGGGLNKLDQERNSLGIIYCDILKHGNQ